MSPWRRFRADRRARVGLRVLVGLLLAAVLADVLASELPLFCRVGGVTYVLPCLTEPAALRGLSRQALKESAAVYVPTPIPFGPDETFAGTKARFTPAPWAPDDEHLLGTDELGRDVAARLVHGARVSLWVGLSSVALNLLLGLWLGLLAAWRGGVVDAVVSRLIEVLTTVPTLFLLLTLIGLWRVQGLWALTVVLGLTRWGELARLARAQGLQLVRQDFVAASRALGAGTGRIIARHLVPNVLGPVLVSAAFAVAAAILVESALSFLGLGVAPPTATWGELLTQAHRTLTHPGAWWLALFPGACIALTVGSLHLVGEGLRRSLDPAA